MHDMDKNCIFAKFPITNLKSKRDENSSGPA